MESIIIRGTKKFGLRMRMLLQDGFFVKIPAPVSLGVMLSTFGINEEYISSRIGTVYYNSLPAENPRGLIVSSGSAIALCGPMAAAPVSALQPGGKIPSGKGVPGPGGYVKISLFDTVLEDTGGLFLSRGIFIGAGELALFLKENENFLNRFFMEAITGSRPLSTFLQLIGLLSAHEEDMILLMMRNVDTMKYQEK